MKPNQFTPGTAFTAFLRIVAVCIPVLMILNAATAQPGTPGYKGKIEFKPTDFTGADSYWYDSDGVDPGVAGCHIGVKGQNDKAPNGRTFGEACQSAQVLIESNPGKGEVHVHIKDVGHPYTVDCNLWCQGAKKAKGGVCTATKGPAPCATSARCECN